MHRNLEMSSPIEGLTIDAKEMDVEEMVSGRSLGEHRRAFVEGDKNRACDDFEKQPRRAPPAPPSFHRALGRWRACWETAGMHGWIRRPDAGGQAPPRSSARMVDVPIAHADLLGDLKRDFERHRSLKCRGVGGPLEH